MVWPGLVQVLSKLSLFEMDWIGEGFNSAGKGVKEEEIELSPTTKSYLTISGRNRSATRASIRAQCTHLLQCHPLLVDDLFAYISSLISVVLAAFGKVQ